MADFRPGSRQRKRGAGSGAWKVLHTNVPTRVVMLESIRAKNEGSVGGKAGMMGGDWKSILAMAHKWTGFLKKK